MTHVEDKRTAILEAALRLISEHGFHGMAMSKLAKEAGVSTGIIYHYFSGKDEVVVELYKMLKTRMGKELLEQLDREQPLIAQIKQLWRAMFRYHIQRPEEVAFHTQFAASPYARCCCGDHKLMSELAPIIECFERAQEEQLIKKFPDPVWGVLIVDVASSLVQKQSLGLLELTDELVDEISESLWQAIRV